MIKELLKPLEWQETEIDGKHFSWVANSALHNYQIFYDHISKEYAAFYYERITQDRGSKRSKSVDELKQWAEEVHYPSKMAKWLNTDPLTDTVNWFKEAKPEPTDKDKLIQTGCHFEEVCEHLEAMGCEGGELGVMAYELKTYTKEQPDSVISEKLSEFNNLDLLDSLADQIVTAVGVAYMMGFDIIGALKEVNASNWSKFVDGKAVTDENGKIIKGSDYFKPELDKFVGGSDE